MKWVKRLLVAIVLAALIVLLAVALLMRWGQGRADLPEKVGDTAIVRVRNFYVDLYGVKTSSTSVILFDAGMATQGVELDSLLAELGVRHQDVTDLFLTHGHPDHFGAAPLLPNARIHAGAADAGLFTGEIGPQKALPRVLSLIGPAAPVVKITNALEGEEQIAIDAGKEIVHAIPMPGHSAGSYVFIFRDV